MHHLGFSGHQTELFYTAFVNNENNPLKSFSAPLMPYNIENSPKVSVHPVS